MREEEQVSSFPFLCVFCKVHMGKKGAKSFDGYFLSIVVSSFEIGIDSRRWTINILLYGISIFASLFIRSKMCEICAVS